ncbi:MAG: hemerythrin domain-containing protein [Burkholderiaceae bacterium]
MPNDPAPNDTDLPALIAHIVERFHERHRRDLPRLVAAARELGPAGAGVAAHLTAMASALEQHMFKEEMRLFPMMEQGGSPLVGLLIDDLEREHRTHEASIERLQSLLAALVVPAGREAAAEAVRAAAGRLVADLSEHVRLEDEDLFARFAAAPRSPTLQC